MPTYEIYRDDGTPIRVEGPEGATPAELVRKYLDEQETASLVAEARKRQREKPVKLSQYLTEIPKAGARGLAGIFETGLLGGATVLPESVEAPVRDVIKRGGEGIRDLLAPAPNVQARLEDDEFQLAEAPIKFSEALGSFGGILGTALFNPLAAGALAAGAGAGEASERARAADATQEERNIAALKGVGAGLTELIPLAGPVGRILKRVPDKIKDGFADRAIDLGIATTAEGAQEALAASLQNMIEQGYNPEQVISEGVTEAGLYGGGVGGAVEAIIQFVEGRKRRRAGDDTKTDDTGDGEGTAVDTQGEQTEEGLANTQGITDDTPTRVGVTGTTTGTDTGRKGPEDDTLKTEEGQETKTEETKTQETQTKDTETEEAAAGFDAVYSGEKQEKPRVRIPGKMVKQKSTAPIKGKNSTNNEEANTRAESTYDQNLYDEYYLADLKDDKGNVIGKQSSEELQQYNNLTRFTVGTRKGTDEVVRTSKKSKYDAPNLPLKDKNKILELIEARPERPTKEDVLKDKFDTEFFVAQTLSKDPVVEDALDEAAYILTQPEKDRVKTFEEKVDKPQMVVDKETGKLKPKLDEEGKPIVKKGAIKEVDPSRVYFQGDKIKVKKPDGKFKTVNNSGLEAATMVSNWVTNNLSPQGQNWFRNRVAYYGQDKAVGTRGQLGKLRTKKQAELTEATKVQAREAQEKATQEELEAKDIKEAAERAAKEGTGLQPVSLPALEMDGLDLNRFIMSAQRGDVRLLQRDELKKQRERAEALHAILVKKGMKKKALDIEAVIDMDVPLMDSTKNLIEEGKLQEALEDLSTTSDNSVVQKISKKLAENVKDTKVVLSPQIMVDGRRRAGAFDPQTNTIELDAERGMTPHVLLHEMTHAQTSAAIANPSNPLTKQIQFIYDNVKDKLDTYFGTESLDEFVAEAFTNPQFQQKLSKLNIKGEKITALQRLANSIGNFIRRLVGLPQKNIDAATITSDIVESLLAPAPEYRDAGKLGMGPESISKILSNLGKKEKTKTYMGDKDKEKFLDDVNEALGDPGFSGIAKDILLSLGDLVTATEIGEAVVRKGMGEDKTGTFRKINRTVQTLRGETEKAGRRFDEVFQQIKPFFKDKQQRDLLDDIIYNLDYGATIHQVDPDGGVESDYKDDQGNDINVELTNGKTKTLVQVWKDNKNKWKNLGAPGRRVFRAMRDHYKNEFKDVQRVINKQVDENLGANSPEAKALKKDVFDKIFNEKTLNVYFPLVREGDYLIRFSRLDPQKPDDNLVVVAVKTESAAKRLSEDLRADPTIDSDSVEFKKSGDMVGDFIQKPPTGFVNNILETLDKGITNKKERDAFKKEVVKLFLTTLPETSLAKSISKRQNREGFNPDSLAAFKEKGFTLGRQAARLSVGKELRALSGELDALRKEFYAIPANRQKAEKNLRNLFGVVDQMPSLDRVIKDVKDRMNFALEGAANKNMEPVFKNLNQGAFLYTIGINASSAIVNLSQIPLFAYPMLGARYGYNNAFGAIMKAGRITANSRKGLDLDLMSYVTVSRDPNTGKDTYTIDKNFRQGVAFKQDMNPKEIQALEAYLPLLQEADGRGQLTKNWIMDALGLGESGRETSIPDKVVGASAYMFNLAEKINRQTLLLASYELAIRKAVDPKNNIKELSAVVKQASPEQLAAATDTALRETQEVNGGATLETGAKISRESWPRVAFMYKGYGLRMYSSMLMSARELLRTDKTLTNEERAIAFKQVVGFHLSALAFAGVYGLPLYGAISMIANMFLDDDEDDADTIVRKTVGEEWYKGVANLLTGVDVASRVRLTGLLIQQNRYNRDATWEENVLFYAGGPALSTMDRLYRGSADVLNGDLERGFESLLPPAVSNVWKGAFGRISRDGYMSRRGDEIYGDPSRGELFGLTLGFAPAEYIRKMERNAYKKGLDNALNTKRSNILKKLYTGLRTGDVPMYNDAFQELMDFNEKHPFAAITADSVYRSMQSHKETSKNIMVNNGINISKQNRAYIMLLEDEWDPDYDFDRLFGFG
jgi:hypothetical protein